MADIRETLDGIQQRAQSAMAEYRALADVCEDDVRQLHATLMDVPNMHAALRAVLNRLDEADRAYERAREQSARVFAPQRVILISAVEHAITEALGGDR